MDTIPGLFLCLPPDFLSEMQQQLLPLFLYVAYHTRARLLGPFGPVGAPCSQSGT